MRSRRGALIVRIVVVLTAAMAWPAVRASADPVPVGVFLEAQPLFAHVRQDLTLSFPDLTSDPTNGARTQAEFFAMYGGVGHQDYQDNIDGQENNDMYALLKRMSFQRPNADPPH